MKDYPTLPPKRIHKRYKRNYRKLTLREALKNKNSPKALKMRTKQRMVRTALHIEKYYRQLRHGK